ncbi:MAG: class I adenylate-forming enzyme family protein [Sporichthyaceae bacterium]
MNVLAVLDRVARRSPHKTALRCRDVSWTYAELMAAAAGFAGFLVRHGVRPGDRVALYMHNEPEYLPALFGIWRAGAVAVPLNYLFGPNALAHAASDSGARFVIALPADTPRLRDVLTGLPLADRLLATGPAEGAAHLLSEAFAAEPLDHIVPRLDGDDALLMYTSGSTGTPKGVRQTHRNTTAVCEVTIDAFDLTPEDHVLVGTPLFHVGGLQLLALPLLSVGGTVTLRRWEVAAWLDDAEAFRPTVVALVPTMLIDIVNAYAGSPRDLSSIRVCMVGGSAMPSARLAAFTEAVGVVPVNIYGQTEQSGLSVTEPPHEARRPGSLGKPLAQIVEHRIVPLGGTDPLPPGADEPGELWVRGDAVTPGYWQLPDVNSAKFLDGWLRTSDLVREDADGYLYFVERTDEMIISGGENISPQTVESHLLQCPLIAEVAVIGTPHERLVNQVTAIVVPAKEGVTAADVAAFCEAYADLRGLLRPRRIEIVEEIPRTGSNKVDRPALKARFASSV